MQSLLRRRNAALLVVAALASAVLVPNLRVALERRRQRRALAEMRRLLARPHETPRQLGVVSATTGDVTLRRFRSSAPVTAHPGALLLEGDTVLVTAGSSCTYVIDGASSELTGPSQTAFPFPLLRAGALTPREECEIRHLRQRGDSDDLCLAECLSRGQGDGVGGGCAHLCIYGGRGSDGRLWTEPPGMSSCYERTASP